VVVLDDPDSDDFLGGLEEEHEEVSDMGLREDPGSFLRYLCARQERVVRSGLRSMPGGLCARSLGCMIF